MPRAAAGQSVTPVECRTSGAAWLDSTLAVAFSARRRTFLAQSWCDCAAIFQPAAVAPFSAPCRTPHSAAIFSSSAATANNSLMPTCLAPAVLSASGARPPALLFQMSATYFSCHVAWVWRYAPVCRWHCWHSTRAWCVPPSNAAVPPQHGQALSSGVFIFLVSFPHAA